jgi:hypothetical protein
MSIVPVTREFSPFGQADKRDEANRYHGLDVDSSLRIAQGATDVADG